MRRVVVEELVTGFGLLALSAVGYGMSHTHGLFWSFLALVGSRRAFLGILPSIPQMRATQKDLTMRGSQPLADAEIVDVDAAAVESWSADQRSDATSCRSSRANYRLSDCLLALACRRTVV